MAIQDASRLKSIAPQLLPLLVDRLGDVKDRYRDLAMNSLVEFWKASPGDVEKTIKEVGFGNKSWRIREQVLNSGGFLVDVVYAMVIECSSIAA